MSNLFSVFDPIAIFGVSWNWLSSTLVLLLVPNLFWLTRRQTIMSTMLIIDFVYNEFIAVRGKFIVPGALLAYVGIFIFIRINNFFGLIPYIFTSSRHLTFTVAIALPLWVGHTILAWLKTPNSTLAHLVPLGTPYPLIPFIVLIELTRRLIRPLTLSVRLAANIVAGHLLLTLLRTNSPNLSYSILSLVMVSLILLCVLETAVALIQAYVFRVLRTLYLNEVNSPPINF